MFHAVAQHCYHRAATECVMKLKSITRHTVDAIVCEDGKAYSIVWDDGLKGFGLRVMATGVRSWIIQARNRTTGRLVKQTLGRVDVLSAKDAYERAAKALGSIHDIDNQQARRSAQNVKNEFQVRDVAEKYLIRKKASLKASSYAALEHHILKVWRPLHGHSANQVTRDDILRVLNTWADRPYAANRARSNLQSMFGWAVAHGLVDQNPVLATPKPLEREEARDRVLEDWEVKAIWRAAGDGQFAAIIRLLLLTGQRRDEVADMRWSEVDLEKALWTIPSERTKNSKAHEVPLSAQALSILQSQTRCNCRDLIFGQGKGGFSGWSKSKKRQDERCEANPWRLHDLRRTMVTRMADMGVPDEVIEATVNHVSGRKGGVAGVYNRSKYLTQKREALNRWAECVGAIIGDYRD